MVSPHPAQEHISRHRSKANPNATASVITSSKTQDGDGVAGLVGVEVRIFIVAAVVAAVIVVVIVT
jgi:uncharacterized phosphosugar-binding protein